MSWAYMMQNGVIWCQNREKKSLFQDLSIPSKHFINIKGITHDSLLKSYVDTTAPDALYGAKSFGAKNLKNHYFKFFFHSRIQQLQLYRTTNILYL